MLGDISADTRLFGNVPQKARSPFKRARSRHCTVNTPAIDRDESSSPRPTKAARAKSRKPSAAAAPLEISPAGEASTQPTLEAHPPPIKAVSKAPGISSFFKRSSPPKSMRLKGAQTTPSSTSAATVLLQPQANATLNLSGGTSHSDASIAQFTKTVRAWSSGLPDAVVSLAARNTVKTNRKTLIVFDDFDQLLEEDPGFVAMVISLLQTSKVRIVTWMYHSANLSQCFKAQSTLHVCL